MKIIDALRRGYYAATDGKRYTISELLEEIRANSGTNDDWIPYLTPEQSRRISACYACANVLSETLAALPLMIFRRLPNGGRERATDHPLYPLLHLRPNKVQTAFQWKELGMQHIAMCGNFYAMIDRQMGEIQQLVPLDPETVKPEHSDRYGVLYKIGEKGKRLTPHKILHIPGPMSSDGLRGQSIIRAARNSIGLSHVTEKFGGLTFKQGATMKGIITIPTKLKDPGRAVALAAEFDEQSQGDNAHRTAVMEEGVKWNQVSMNLEDAQFILTRAHQIPEIARFFRMPPHKIQHLDRATFTNIEHQGIEFATDTMMPWLIRWSEQLTRRLLTELEQEEYFIAFVEEGLYRGDMEAENNALKIQREMGVLSANEIRKMKNMPPRDDPGGDTYVDPGNMGAMAMEEPPDDPPTGTG